MRIPKVGEKGFTLIELLIVVAILGVLAAVVIPNVGQFIGRGQDEAAATELAAIQSAVSAMMVDNGLEDLSDNSSAHDTAGEATNDMGDFPDGALGGATLFHYGNVATVNYVQTQNTTSTYWVDVAGTVTQIR